MCRLFLKIDRQENFAILVDESVFICRQGVDGGGGWRKTKKLPQKISVHSQLFMCIFVYVYNYSMVHMYDEGTILYIVQCTRIHSVQVPVSMQTKTVNANVSTCLYVLRYVCLYSSTNAEFMNVQFS